MKQAQVQLVAGREAGQVKCSKRGQVGLGKLRGAVALGLVGNHQQQIVLVVALGASGLAKLVFEGVEPGVRDGFGAATRGDAGA